MKKLKKALSLMLVLAMAFSTVAGFHSEKASAATTAITGNDTKGTAYNCGSWSSMASMETALMESDVDESWFKFTVGAGERIYVRVSTTNTYVGMTVRAEDGLGNKVDREQTNPMNIIDSTGVTPGLYVNIDNDSSSTKTYYVKVGRGEEYEGNMYFSLSAQNRIRTGSGAFTFTGTASNPGNTRLDLNGVDSSVISLNLTKSTAIPDGAIVTSVKTSGTQSPSQGNVRHKINPSSTSTWYTSTVKSATSGSYNIKIADGFQAKQTWNFKYNAQASAKSTMKNVKLTINWQYDLKDTNYKIFTK